VVPLDFPPVTVLKVVPVSVPTVGVEVYEVEELRHPVGSTSFLTKQPVQRVQTVGAVLRVL